MSMDLPVISLKSIDPAGGLALVGVVVPENGSLKRNRDLWFPTDLRFWNESKVLGPT